MTRSLGILTSKTYFGATLVLHEQTLVQQACGIKLTLVVSPTCDLEMSLMSFPLQP